LHRDDRGAPAPDDARLLGRDGSKRPSEDRGVVVTDRGDDRDLRIERVRRVQPATEPHLDDGDRAVALGERAQREQERELERRGLACGGMLAAKPRDEGAKLFDGSREVRLAEHRTVDADALAIGLEVRRGEQAGADARRVQHRGEERRGRALALRSGDQHDPQLPVRLAR